MGGRARRGSSGRGGPIHPRGGAGRPRATPRAKGRGRGAGARLMSVTSTPSPRARETHGGVPESRAVTPPSAHQGCPPRRRGVLHLRGGPARRPGCRRDGSRGRIRRIDGDTNVAFTGGVTHESRGGARAPRASAPRRRRRRRSDRRRVRGRGRAPGLGRVGEGAPHPRRKRRGRRDTSARGSRIADRRRPFALCLARVRRATRRRRVDAPRRSGCGIGAGRRRRRVGARRWRERRCGPRETDVGYRTRSGRRRTLSGCLRVHFGVPPAADIAAAAFPRAPARGRGVRGIGSGTRPGVHEKDISVEPGAAAAVNAASRSRARVDGTPDPRF